MRNFTFLTLKHKRMKKTAKESNCYFSKCSELQCESNLGVSGSCFEVTILENAVKGTLLCSG